MRPKTLKNSLMLTIALLVIASGLGISQIVTHRYGASLIEGAVAQAENIAHKLSLDAADKVLINDLVALQKLLDDQMTSNRGIAYLFVVRESRILTHTFFDGVPVRLIAANAPISEKGHLEKIVSEKGERFLDIAWPIFDGRAGTLRLGLSEAPYRHQVVALWLQMSLITLGILVAALIAGHLFVNWLTRPLIALAGAAEGIDAGNLDTRVTVVGGAEVNRLAFAFNRMLDRLRDYTFQLKESNEKLERKNAALDRAHRQLSTSFTISQEVAALVNLQDVCAYLIDTLKNIVECRNMAMIIFDTRRETVMLCSEDLFKRLDPAKYDAAFAMFADKPGRAMIVPEEITDAALLPENYSIFKKLLTFSITHQGQFLGALVIGCPGNCRCVQKELGVIDLVLKQTAGAIKRTLVQDEEIRALELRAATSRDFSGIVGRDPKMQLVFKLIDDVAPTDATVIIQGDSGTGKELVARAIHHRSPRDSCPFVVINCAAYPSTLLESELFGHEKGAFSGALRRKIGRFELADKGTVFLDEIGEISPSAQIKLLRVLQSQKFERLGAERSVSVDVRVLAATNKNLLQEVKAGRFREDLYYRLNVIPINLPTLAQRHNDILLLAKHFLKRFCMEQEKSIEEFSTEAMRLLMNYGWPGNVRELENSIEHAAVLGKGSVIEPVDLPEAIVNSGKVTVVPATPTLVENEAKLVSEALEESNWNKTEAALRLGISRSTLYEKLKKYHITAPTLH